MIYRFESFELDSDRYLLRRGGAVVKVEPKVLELLTFLIRHRQRLVSKEEILAALWAEDFVTDSVLTRCVYLARQALGDSSQTQAFIKTVHGRGYQLSDEVAVTEAAEAAPAGGEAEPVPLEPVLEAVEPRSGRRWRRLAPLVIGLAAAVVAGAVWMASRPPARQPAGPGGPAAGTPPVRLGLVPLEVAAGEAELELTALSVVDLLRSRLAGIDDILVRDVFDDAEAGGFGQLAAQWGVEYMIVGKVEPGDGPGRSRVSLILRHALPDGGEGRTGLGTFLLPGLADGELAEYVRVREMVCHSVITALTPSRNLPAERGWTPTDAEAYRLFLLAYQGVASDFCENSTAAVELALRSLDRDPSFAPSWLVLGVAYTNQVWACGQADDQYRKALEALEEADRLAPGSATVAGVRSDILAATGRLEEAFELCLQQNEIHPRNPHAAMGRVYLLTHAGFPRQAETLLHRVLELDPWYFSTAAYTTVPAPLLYLRRWDDFLHLLAPSDSAYFRFYRGLAEHLRGNDGAARTELEHAYQDSPFGVFGRLAQGLLAAIDGRREAAVAIIDQLARQRLVLEASDGEVTYKQAQILALAGADEEALAQLQAAVDEGFFCASCFELDPTLSRLHDHPGFRAAVEQARQRHLEFARRFDLEPELGLSGRQ